MSMNSTDNKIRRSAEKLIGDEPSRRKVPLSAPVNRNRTNGGMAMDSVREIRSFPPRWTSPVNMMESKIPRTKGTTGAVVGSEKPMSLPDKFRQSLKTSNKHRSNLSYQKPPIGKSRLGLQESSSSSSSSSNTSSSSTSPSSASHCGDSAKANSTSAKPSFRRFGSSPDLFSFQLTKFLCLGTSSRTSTSTLRLENRPSSDSTSTPTSHDRSRSVPPSRSWTSTPQRQPALKVWGNIVPSGKIYTGMRGCPDTNLNVLNPGNKNYGVGTVIMPWCRHRDSDVVMSLTYKFEETSLSVHNRGICRGFHRNHYSGNNQS